MNLREELLAAVDAAAAEKNVRVVLIKGFPKFWVRDRSVGEVDEQKLNDDDWIKEHTLSAAASLVICDADGVLLFDPTNEKDRELMKRFAKLPWGRIAQKIVAAAQNDEELDAGN